MDDGYMEFCEKKDWDSFKKVFHMWLGCVTIGGVTATTRSLLYFQPTNVVILTPGDALVRQD